MTEAATLCDRGCNPLLQRPLPFVAEAATISDRGCNLYSACLHMYVQELVEREKAAIKKPKVKAVSV